MDVDYNAQISAHFKYTEALYLPSWGRHAIEADGLTVQILSNLKDLFEKVDKVREMLDKPLIVLCAYRPCGDPSRPRSNYNALVGGAPKSPHIDGMAVDFHSDDFTADEIRAHILKENKLEELGLRMEDRPGSGWVHLDTRKPEFERPRFFKP